MRIGMNLPGPFYASWRVGGRRGRSRSSSPGLFGALILLPFWMVIGMLWIYWQMLRVIVFLIRPGYEWLAPIMRRHFAAWRETRRARKAGSPPSANV